jgi:hypothetical protein
MSVSAALTTEQLDFAIAAIRRVGAGAGRKRGGAVAAE